MFSFQQLICVYGGSVGFSGSIPRLHASFVFHSPSTWHSGGASSTPAGEHCE